MQGAIVAGLLPILLPLTVSRAGSATNIGLVMAALSLGGLTAPAWGLLSDRYRLHRWLLAGGLFVMFAGLIGFTLTTRPALWIGLAMFLGFGAASAATVANLFIVEDHPKSEWDERIGWLQTFYGVGQVCGLLLAGVLSQADLRIGLIVAAILSGIAAVVGWSTTKTHLIPLESRPVLLHPARQGEWAISMPQRLFHHLNLKAIRKLGSSIRSAFGLFLLVWLLAIAGSTAFFSQYPVLMRKVYGISANTSSIAFAIVAGLGLVLYTPAGNWSERYGPGRVMRAALGIRWLAYVGILGLAFTHNGFQGGLAVFAFAFIVCAWSLISVSGTALAAQLSSVGEGEGLGIFNATNALGGVLGASLGGWAAGLWGYKSIAALAVACIALSLVFSMKLPSTEGKEENAG
jgi:MFS family permease